MKSKAIKLLASGLSQSQVAAALGVGVSTVSEWMLEEDFRNEVEVGRVELVKRQVELDEGYDKIERDLQRKLEKSLAWVSDPMKIAKMLQMINGMKKRGGGRLEEERQRRILEGEFEGIGSAEGAVVVLGAGASRVIDYKKNVQNEIVEVEGRSMVTKETKKLLEEIGRKIKGE